MNGRDFRLQRLVDTTLPWQDSENTETRWRVIARCLWILAEGMPQDTARNAGFEAVTSFLVEEIGKSDAVRELDVSAAEVQELAQSMVNFLPAEMLKDPMLITGTLRQGIVGGVEVAVSHNASDWTSACEAMIAWLFKYSARVEKEAEYWTIFSRGKTVQFPALDKRTVTAFLLTLHYPEYRTWRNKFTSVFGTASAADFFK